MTAFYSEHDKQKAAWLRELIVRNLIAPGVVDERDIEDIAPDELRGYTQCHFFAGIGGWSHALRLAGWPDDRRIWTGSCPCQPFSSAGKGAGFADERHLWPAFHHLIAQCRPPEVAGEQVASKDADAWVDLVQADMEGVGYAYGCVPFPSAGVGSPQIRDRNFWLGVGLADANDTRLEGRWIPTERAPECASRPRGVAGGMADLLGFGRSAIQRVSNIGLARGTDSERARLGLELGGATDGAGPANGFWRAADWLGCTDGKWRPVEPGTFPLAHGIPARVVRVRGYGDAINAEAAAEFIRAYLEARESVMAAAA